MSNENVAVQDDLVEAAKENLGASNRAEAVEMSLFLATVVENADELLGVHEYRESVERGEL